MKLSCFFYIFLFSIFSCVFTDATEVVTLKPEKAQLKGARLKDQKNGTFVIFCFHSKGFEAKWDVDIPEAGTYIVELEFGCPGPNSGHPFEFKVGKASFVWTSFDTKGWWEFKRRHIQKIKLEKGKQAFSVSPVADKGINISCIRLISDPGFVVSPVLNGDVELKPELADLTKSSLYPNNVLGSYGESVSWNISLPEAIKYKVFLNYAAPSGGKVEIKSPAGNLSSFLTGTGNWEKFENKEIGEISMPAGESALVLSRSNGVMDIKGVRLVNSAVAEKALAALKSKPRLGMSLEELEMLWGTSQEDKTVPSIDRKGGKEDVDWELYKEALPFLTSRVWLKPGMKITAYLLKDRCLGLSVNLDIKDIKAAYGVTDILMPGVTFKWNPNLMTIYSTDKKYKFQYWGAYFELKDSGMLRALKEKGSIAKVVAGDRILIGKTLSELQEMLGTGSKRQDYHIDRRGDQADLDWSLYKEIRPATTGYCWTFPEKDNLRVTAIFLKDKCIALEVSKKNVFTTREIVNNVKELLPGVSFASIPSSPAFTIYSTNPPGGFKLQNWGSYFEIKASGAIRQMMKDREARLKDSSLKLINLMKNCEILKKKSMFGQTRQELDTIWGASTDSQVEYCGRPTCVWRFPDCDIEIYGSFEKQGNELVCSYMTIVDSMQNLPLDTAFSVARQMVAPYTIENFSKDEMKSWFSVRSKERGNRFLVEWYNDPNSRACIRITDTNSVKKKENDSEAKKGLDDIRKLL